LAHISFHDLDVKIGTPVVDVVESTDFVKSTDVKSTDVESTDVVKSTDVIYVVIL